MSNVGIDEDHWRIIRIVPLEVQRASGDASKVQERRVRVGRIGEQAPLGTGGWHGCADLVVLAAPLAKGRCADDGRERRGEEENAEHDTVVLGRYIRSGLGSVKN